MKTVILILLCVFIAGCDPYRIEQCVRENHVTLNIEMKTYVWCNNDIIQSWADPIDEVNTELVRRRHAQADSLVFALRLMDN